MSSSKDLEDDEYIAKLLAEDAKKSSIRYSSMGLSALLPQRPTNAAPKPNTRFLKSIIRETDNHNAALKKKEELEARIRLRKMSEGEAASRTGRGHDDGRERKRRRLSDNENGAVGPSDTRSERRRRNSSPSRSRSGDRAGHRSTRYQRRDESDYEEYHHRSRHQRAAGQRSRSSDRTGSRRYDRSRKARPPRDHHKRRKVPSESESLTSETSEYRSSGKRGRDGRDSRRKNSRSRSPRRRISSAKQGFRSSKANPKIKQNATNDARVDESGSLSRSSSSDPLESLVGPLPPQQNDGLSRDPPPLRSRGRGAYRINSSAMDEHFSTGYNPKLDMHPEAELLEEKEDWDMALEALRDRAMWKQKHAERLREAGFGDEDIKKWEDSGKEKDTEDVKWKGKGEAREWDLGKVAQDSPGEKPKEDGLEAAWKRKDGGFLKSFKKALG